MALHPVFGVQQPATLFHRMDEVDAVMKATNAAITLNLTPSDYTRNWADFFARWVAFNASERSVANLLSPAAWLLRSDDVARETEAKAGQLEEIRAQYPLQPPVPHAPLSGPSVPKLPFGEGGAFPVATVAVVVGVVAIAAVAVLYAPEIKLALGARR